MSILSFLKPKTKTESSNLTTQEQEASSTTLNTQQQIQQQETTGSQQTSGTTTQDSRNLTTQQDISASTGSQTGQTLQQTSNLSAPALALIEGLAQGGEAGAQQSFDTQQLLSKIATDRVGQFNEAQFVSDILASATSRSDQNVEQQTNRIANAVGGTAGDNSAVALLNSRIRGEADARISGVRADATAQASDIARANLSQASDVGGQGLQNLLAVIQSLSGAQTTQIGSSAQQTEQQAQTSGESAARETVAGASQQNQQSQETQNLLALIESLIQQDSTQSGTSTSEGTGQQTGTVFQGILGALDVASKFGKG